LSDTKNSLLGNLEKNKAKVNHNHEYEVTITETLKMTVTVEAKSRDEAEQIVSDNWHNSEYILDADNFVGVEFEAKPVKRDITHGKDI